MIKTMILYSDMDNLIVTYFVVGVGVFFLICWFPKKLNTNDSIALKPRKSNHELYIENYTLNFNIENVGSKKTTLLTKVILCSLSLAIAILPFYEFVETLRPIVYEPHWACFLS